MEEKNKQMGTVIFFNNMKCFGFIRPDSGGRDIFVHFSGINAEGYKTLNQGDRVSYLLGENHKGPCAVDVVVEQKA